MEAKRKIEIIGFATFFILMTVFPTALFSGAIMEDTIIRKGGNLQIYATLGDSEQIKISINELPYDTPQKVTYYRVLGEEYDEEIDPDCMNTQDDLPSEEEARTIAEGYIESHEGLPDGAVLKDIQSQYLGKVTNGEEVERIPLLTEVTYGRIIDGMPVVGPGDFILVCVGENGKILAYLKTWRNLEEAGQTNIITVNDAIAELEKGKTIETPISPYRGTITIDDIYLGYYSKPAGEKQEFYEPVWIFDGFDSKGEYVNMVIEAST